MIMHSICARVYIHLLFFLILSKVAFSFFYLFMDELHRAVVPFLPASGGIHSVFPITSTNDNQQQPGPYEGQARAPRNVLKEDQSLGHSFRNACIKQESIIQVMTQLLQEQGVHIDEQEIRSGVDLFFKKTMDLEPGYRNRKLKRI